MDEELTATIVAIVVQPIVVGALLSFDRKRLDEYGRSRMWNRATLEAAINPLIFPAPFAAFGAHVWLTRPGRWWSPKRVGKGLLGAVIAYVACTAVMLGVLFVIDLAFGSTH